jgi:hypothetical protein
VAVAFHAGNLKAVAKVLRAAHPSAELTLCADDDRLIDRPATWLTMIAPDCDLKEARRSLRLRFGERLATVVEHRHRRLPR